MTKQRRIPMPLAVRRTAVSARILAALIAAAAVLAGAGAAGADGNQFLLRAPAAEIDGIAATHGLTVLDQLDPSADALNRLVYLVEAPVALVPAQVIADVLAMEPEAAGMERAVVASVSEIAAHPSLGPDSR